MLRINKDIIEKLYKHGEIEAPLEACGYLVGKDDMVIKHYPMTNIDKSEDHFALDPKEQFKVLKEARAESLQILGVYHTHPDSPARPSEEDIKLAYDTDIIYIIASLLDKNYSTKAFRIIQGKVSEEKLIIGE